MRMRMVKRRSLPFSWMAYPIACALYILERSLRAGRDRTVPVVLPGRFHAAMQRTWVEV